MKTKKELELYVHIPFCVRKCAYCDFLSAPAGEQTREQYIDALVDEIKAYQSHDLAKNRVVTTIFFGGGTPSILEGDSLVQIVTAIRDTFEVVSDAEITIEVNPGTVTGDKLEKYRSVGVNRMSFGLQSTDNAALKNLGRIHTYEEFLESYQLARDCGFDNINVDLISAIPKQTLSAWEQDLERVIALAPEHISAYSLIVEEGTPFAGLYGEGAEREGDLPSEEEERLMYQRTEEILARAGYHRYEISNYAREGKACRHNLGYWNRTDYLGLGLGASSLVNQTRFKNTEILEEYLKDSGNPDTMRRETEHLSLLEQMEETVFLGLRKMQGISIEEVRAQFGPVFEIRYGDNIRRMENEGLIVIEDPYFKLTKKGIDVSNYVFAEVLK